MRLYILLALLLTTLNLRADEDNLAAVGTKAPAFSGVAIDGAKVTLDSLSGKVILLNFFATWCGPCMVEMPHIEKEVWQANKSPAFAVIAVGREHSIEELTTWKKSTQLTFTILADPRREIYSKYANQYIPRCYVIGKDGLIKYASKGYDEREFATMKKIIAAEIIK